MHQQPELCGIALYREHIRVQETVEGHCEQLGQVQGIPEDRRRDW